MKTLLPITAGLVACASLACGCIVQSNHDEPQGPGEPVTTTSSPIEDGSPINQGGDPVSLLFPLSTVDLTTPNLGRCTGVILSVLPVTKILTAAHCRTNAQTQVWLYPYGRYAGSKPDLKHPLPVAGPPDLQTGLGVCDQTVENSVPDTCYSEEGSHHYADLAVLTLVTPLSSPYRRVILAPQGPLATKVSTWAVGAGLVNLALWAGCDSGTFDLNVINPDRDMWWVPAAFPDEPLISGGKGDTFSSIRNHADPGDSGGPAYQYMSNTLLVGADGYNLQLTGILSDGACGGSQGWDEYTSTQFVDNFNWLIKEGGSVTSFVETDDGGLQDDSGSAESSDSGDTLVDGGGNATATSPDGAVNGALREPGDVGASNGGGCTVARGSGPSSESLAPLAALALLAARRRRAAARRDLHAPVT